MSADFRLSTNVCVVPEAGQESLLISPTQIIIPNKPYTRRHARYVVEKATLKD
jgi:hypothetical protein